MRENSEGNFDSEGVSEVISVGGDNSGETIEGINGVTGLEDGGADGDNSEEVVSGVSCRMQQIQYSLRNFQNNFECVNTGANGCVEFVANCSMGVYNLDGNTSGVFGIRYSLIDLNDEELDFELVERNVEFDTSEVFSVEFVRSDVSGVDENLFCSFSVDAVPMKEVCN